MSDLESKCSRTNSIKNGHVSMIDKENLNRNINNNPFKATTMWNDIQSVFRKKMPLRKHRIYLRYYDDSFTGKEAVDFLLEELPSILIKKKEISRTSCEQLLQLLMNKKLFYNVRNEMDTEFKDGLSVFKFNENFTEHIIKVKRSSSVNENTMRRISLRGSDIKARRIDEKVTTISDVPRPSLSQQDLSIYTNDRSLKLKSFYGLDNNTIKDAIKFNTHNVNRSHSTSSSSKSKDNQTPANVLKTFDASNRPAAKTYSNKPNSSRKITSTTIKNNLIEEKQQSREEISSWRLCILSFLREYLDPKGLSHLLPSHIDDTHVTFNCEKIGSKGIVKCFNDNEEMSSHLLKMMRFLARYPFDSKQFVDPGQQYVGMELDTYRNILNELSKNKAILPTTFSNLLIQIYKIYNNVENLDNNCNDESESIFRKFADTPLSRLISKNTNRGFNLDPFVRNSQRSSFNNVESKKIRKPIPFKILQEGGSTNRVNTIKHTKNDSMLPGLRTPRHSFDLTVMENMISPYFSPNTEKQLDSPYKVNHVIDDAILTDLITYLLLLLPSQARRKLHIVIRFMSRISQNHCLKLSKTRTNRIVVLKTLTPMIISCDTEKDIKMNSELIAFIMDKEMDIFQVPRQLIKERETFLRFPDSAEMVRLKALRSLPEKILILPGFENIPNSPIQYCERINLKDFNQQARDLEKHMESILNEYLTNKNFSENERKKKIKEFKKCYPDIYKKHFPDEVEEPDNQSTAQSQSFVKRVKNLIRQ
uniref:DEP domain-containing protein n=1 Tax=Parastrongyloides trichosuri TaxID=131310 RepID=A0A0N4ZGA4_PARTI